jgi:hypothetical protein
MGGHGRATALLDAALLRFTEAKVAVWLDNLTLDFLARLREEPGFERTAAVDKEVVPERRTLAKLMVIAGEQEKEVHPVGGRISLAKPSLTCSTRRYPRSLSPLPRTRCRTDCLGRGSPRGAAEERPQEVL